MRVRSYLLAVAAICALHPVLAGAQVQPPPGVDPSRVHIRRDPTLDTRGPGWDFDFGMKPGPNHEYGYVYVARVEPGNAADRAGLIAGDTILTVDGRDTRLPPLFPRRVPGTRYVLRIKRGHEEREVIYVYPSPPPAEPARPASGTAPRE